ncbi:MAG: hypothetical protein DRO73_11325 [Candidatus Thorarchaeota archaeon]|nr:MAG: hypothetical protein DRO73_11325 [Candidatus Thorarchaeota archaeon]
MFRHGECMAIRRHGRVLKLETLVLLVAVLSPMWVMPLSAPMVSDVVVVMHHDSAVSTAVRTIVANGPNVEVVEYGSLEYALTIHRVVRRVVWVSHGSEDGILAGSQVLSWQAFSSRIEMTPGKDIVLACNSAEINQYVSKGSVLSFGGAIDAILGGLIASFVLFSSPGMRRSIGTVQARFVSRLTDLFTDPAAPIFLHYTEGGSPPAPSPPPTYDFYYKGIYWDAYNIDPDNEVFYDHPDYTYYYKTMGVGPALGFTIDCSHPNYNAGDFGMKVDHVSRATVEFWKAGGVASLGEVLLGFVTSLIALGIALGVITGGTSLAIAAAIIGVVAAVFAIAGLTVTILASTILPDEKGAGWVFYELLGQGEMRMKIGCGWWLHIITDGCSGIAWPEPCDGHYIRK